MNILILAVINKTLISYQHFDLELITLTSNIIWTDFLYIEIIKLIIQKETSIRATHQKVTKMKITVDTSLFFALLAIMSHNFEATEAMDTSQDISKGDALIDNVVANIKTAVESFQNTNRFRERVDIKLSSKEDFNCEWVKYFSYITL